ncbi:MAG: cation-translocating P-type ATPase [Verrucomicrobia bacterium]|nr:cation-translocating P-type ATPase [Verrucomicrobiota bacterium]
MSRDRETLAFATARSPERPHCAYCDAPLPPDAAQSHGAKYCCYGCRVLGEAGRKPVAQPEIPSAPWFKIAVVVVLAGQAMLLGLAANLSEPAGDARWLMHAALMLSSFAALAILGRPLLQSTVADIKQRRVSIELFFLIGIAGALGASIHSTITGVGAIYYEVVAVLLTVYSVGRTLGAQSRARALAETRHLVHTFETCQKIGPDGAIVPTRVAEIRPGDQVRVLPGEPIPVDGRIVYGQAFVCETPLTGEPFPVVRRTGDAVLAGSYSEDGELRIAATVAGNARRLDILLAALESAREKPCRLQAQADHVVRWFLPLVLLASAGTFAAWTWWSGWPVGLFNALAVLVVACPCAMGLATPVALWNALAAFAARGLVVRGGDILERLAALDRVVFDKTGTLSEERYSLIDLATNGSSEERTTISAQLRAVQSDSTHPVARAFHSPSAVQKDAAFRVRSLKTIPALGVEAWLESPQGGENYMRIGQRELLSDLGNESELLASLRRGPGDPLVYVEVDGRLRAIAAVRERVRDSARDTIAALQQLGVESAVMTGDRPERAAELLGRQDIEGRLAPQDKAERVEAMKRAGHRVAFVGDGVNDAPAINAAGVGIALAHGAGVTTASADAILYGGDLCIVPWAVALARHVRDSIRSNLLFAACYNAVGIALAASGLLHPVAAALLMLVSSFTVSWRALRSTESGDVCCTLPAPPEPTTEVRRSRSQWLYAILVVTQTPFLIYLGQLETFAAVGLSVVMLALGAFIARFRTRNAEVFRFAQMTFAMLGPCNWGMILGWWADAGFAPAVMGCPCCHAASFSLLSFAAMPWMNAGMLLLGVPPMVFDPTNLKRGLNRLSFAALSAVGMVWGMSFGDLVFMKWLGPMVPSVFLLSFAGMTIGMLLGMFLCCELGRSIGLAWRRRKA